MPKRGKKGRDKAKRVGRIRVKAPLKEAHCKPVKKSQEMVDDASDRYCLTCPSGFCYRALLL